MSSLLSFLLQQGDGFRRARLPSLYADFQAQRHSNPDGFHANYTAWIEALTKAARAGALPYQGPSYDTLSLRTGEDLLQALETSEYGRPLALRAVVDEAVAQRKLVPQDEFLSSTRSMYSRKWTIQPWWLLSWALNNINPFGSGASDPSLPAKRYVFIQNAENASARIIALIGGKTRRIDRIFSRAAFQQEAGKALGVKDNLSAADLGIVLKHLSRDRNAIFYDRDVVVFKHQADQTPGLTREDKSIASLKTLISEVQEQVDVLSVSVEKAGEKAKQALERKNRTLALAALKSKRINERALDQRTGTLSQLEEVYYKIEQAADQVSMIRVMEASSGVLRSLQKEVGEIDRVQDIVEDLKDQTQKVDEVGQIIQSAGQEPSAVDDQDVEDELEAMLQEKKMDGTAEDLADMPDVTQLPEPGMKDSKDSKDKLQTSREPSKDVTEQLNRLSLEIPRKEEQTDAS